MKPRGRCKFCGRVMRYASLPNRGPVMVHGKGERVICDRLRALGRDLISQEDRRTAEEIQRLGQRKWHGAEKP